MLRQKDMDADWTRQSNDRRHYGYKAHVSVDRDHKLVRKFTVTPASRHESKVMSEVVDDDNSGDVVWADRGYASKENERMLSERGLVSWIMRKASRGRKLSEGDRRVNESRARDRARVEHVFGSMENELCGNKVRSIGLERAHVRIGLKMICYNMRRMLFLQVHRVQAC